MKSEFIANTIHNLHGLLIIFIFLGNFFLPVKYLPYFAVLIIIIMLDWNDFDGMCILTKLEHYARTGQWVAKAAIEKDAPEFFRPFMYSLTGYEMTREGSDKLNNFLFLLILLITILRIQYQKK
jgi:hypothetical protein